MVAIADKNIKITETPKIKRTKFQSEVIIIEETDNCEHGISSKETSGNTNKAIVAIPEKNVKITEKNKKTKKTKSKFKNIKKNRRLLQCAFCKQFDTPLKSKLISHMVKHKKDFLKGDQT